MLITQKSHTATDLWKAALFVDERDDVQWLLSQEIENGLIVLELNPGPVDPLLVVFLLLHLEDVTHEELLEVLVAVVDAHLLETVLLEGFKAENVQHTDGNIFLPFLLKRSEIVFVKFLKGTYEIIILPSLQ